MSKRQHQDAAKEINETAKSMAISFQLKQLTDAANRQLRKPVRPPPKCRFCTLEHYTGECSSISQAEKITKCIELGLCFICLNKGHHHAALCRLLKHGNGLCKRPECFDNYSIHHESICEHAKSDESQVHRQGDVQ
ncbi:hypothetical protein B9Z55_003045 [Caenorhabditis nigoni]|uniref:Uncharacterized protein n=1 Tax=Caenorhabditis nigoni TaxID=1611254 RepID=A0A2G5VNQ8_9PELO|nr:hypothetical protein B9Z55_003045 [Caenorhabditis nigoni]